jgi:hypothetical protein
MSIDISNTGAWNWNSSEEDHSANLDVGFINYAIGLLVSNNTKLIMDFGCATGYYLRYLYDHTFDIELIGIEAHASQNKHLHFPNIIDVDLTTPFLIQGRRGSVICLEVMEHIPPQLESIVIDNIVRHCDGYLFMSWAPVGQGGHGHLNEKKVEDVIKLFTERGFDLLLPESNAGRMVSSITWLKNNLLVFKKKNSDILHESNRVASGSCKLD